MAKKGTMSLYNPDDLFPSLRAAIQAGGLDGAKLTVGFLDGTSPRTDIPNRQKISLHDGKKPGEWEVPSLRELFRGDKRPPDLTEYPEEYVPVFYFIEKHALTADAAAGRLRDREWEEIYSTLRRRPDGKSTGPVHDFIWQVAATLLGLRSTSQVEFEEVFGRLARSCRHFQMGATSRNYMENLKSGFDSL
jgi:hypothetical protein